MAIELENNPVSGVGANTPSAADLDEMNKTLRIIIEKARLDELPAVIEIIASEDVNFCSNFSVARTTDVIARIQNSKDPGNILVPGNPLGQDISNVDTKYGLRDRLRQLAQEKALTVTVGR